MTLHLHYSIGGKAGVSVERSLSVAGGGNETGVVLDEDIKVFFELEIPITDRNKCNESATREKSTKSICVLCFQVIAEIRVAESAVTYRDVTEVYRRH